MPKKIILHVDIDAFFASIEQILHPELRGRSVIVGGREDDSSVVASASYEARRRGVRTAMTIAQAKRICPEAVFLRGDYNEYKKFSDRMTAILQEFSPEVETVSLDDVYVDLSGFDRLYGPAIDTAERIRNRIEKETGLSVSIGVASNKLVAKIATDIAKPRGIAYIKPGYEREFLAPMDIGRLPGVGPATRETLHQFNLQTIGELAQIQEDILKAVFGENGALLSRRAKGIDERAVESKSPKSVSRETTFESDVADRHVVEGMLYYLTERVARKLRELRLRAKSVQVKIRYADFETISRSRARPHPTDQEEEIYELVLDLLRTILTRRIRVRLVGISVSGLTRAGSVQGDLFCDARADKRRRLHHKLDRIRDRYGFSAVTAGRALELLNKMEKGFHGFKLRTSCLTR